MPARCRSLRALPERESHVLLPERSRGLHHVENFEKAGRPPGAGRGGPRRRRGLGPGPGRGDDDAGPPRRGRHEVARVVPEAGEGGQHRPALPRRLDHPGVGGQRGLATLLRPAQRGQLRHRRRPDRARPLAARARRGRGDSPQGRRPDDRHQQLRLEHRRGDRQRRDRHRQVAPREAPRDEDPPPGRLPPRRETGLDPRQAGGGQRADRQARRRQDRQVPRHRQELPPGRRHDRPRRHARLPAPEPQGLSHLGRRHGADLAGDAGSGTKTRRLRKVPGASGPATRPTSPARRRRDGRGLRASAWGATGGSPTPGGGRRRW